MKRPLEGITVVGLEQVIAGPFCTRQLADVIVAVCTPNFKTIDAMLRVTDSFRPERRADLAGLRPNRPATVCATCRPTRTEPVNETSGRRGSWLILSPTSSLLPMQRVKMPCKP